MEGSCRYLKLYSSSINLNLVSKSQIDCTENVLKKLGKVFDVSSMRQMSQKKIKKRKAMTEQNFLNIIGNKISNEMQKTLIKNNFQPQLADQLCNFIDSHEKADLFQRMMNEWIVYQNRQQQILNAYMHQQYR